MNNTEIKKHNILKQAALYVYDINNNKIPDGYNLLGVYTYNNGFEACVLKKDNDIIISYRGTKLTDINDIKNDLKMWKHIPAQAHQAIELYDYIKHEYPNAEITVTGHSLGGSLSQIVSAERKINAVTFNAYGTKNLFSDISHIREDKIVNYCNPSDIFTTWNARNHIGKCYAIYSNNSEGIPHKLEKMQPLENRILSSPKNLQDAWIKIKLMQGADNTRNNYKHLLNNLRDIKHHSGCVGSYRVSGYTKKDGTKVSDYIRTCGAKHTGVQNYSNRFYGMHNNILTKEQTDRLLNEMLYNFNKTKKNVPQK